MKVKDLIVALLEVSLDATVVVNDNGININLWNVEVITEQEFDNQDTATKVLLS